MEKILIIYISRDLMNIRNIRNHQNFIKKMKERFDVEISCVTSDNKINPKWENIVGDFKYKFICDNPQVSKICSIFNNIEYEDYDWYMKIRPEIFFRDFNFDNFSKEGLNVRLRDYYGPNINVPHGLSVNNRNNYKKCDKTLVNVDDQIFIFHNKIAKSFYPLNLEEIITEKIYDFKKYKFLKPEINVQREGFFSNILQFREIKINIFGFNVSMNGLPSSNLIINNNSHYLDEKIKNSWLDVYNTGPELL